MPTYYVDSSSPTASDQNSGLSPGQAFQSLSALNSKTFAAGDLIEFKSGTSYSGGLVVSSSGTAAAPITFTTYGGSIQPTISNSGIWSNAVSIVNASYVVFDGVGVNGAHQAGYYVNSVSSHISIKNAEMTSVGEGVLLEGSSNIVEGNYIHDLHMVVNTTGASTDDYGANGVVIAGTQNVITGNLILRAKSASYDWGSDGGAFELFGTVDGTQITDNWVQDSQGFLEAGGQPGHAYNILVSNNVSYNNGTFVTLHNSGGEFGAQFKAVDINHNTVVETQNNSTSLSEVFLDGPATPDSISFTKNIVWLNNGDSLFKTVGTYHSNNVFNIISPTTHVYNNWDNTLGPGEVLADPKFQNLALLQLRPAPSGPAADAGAVLTGQAVPAPTSAQLVPDPPVWTDLAIPVSPDQPPNQTPIVSVHDVAVPHNTLVPVSSLFSLIDPKTAPVQYQFVDWNKNGYLVFNGVIQPTGLPVEVSPEHLSQVSVYAGVGTDSIQVLAFDGSYWSGANTTVAGTNSPPTVTTHPGSGIAGQSVALSTLLSVTDAEGDPAASFRVVDWNDSPGAGYLIANGVRIAPSTPTLLSPQQFASATYVYGSVGDAVAVQAFDGIAWSDWSTFTTNPVSPLVSMTIGTQSAAPGTAFNLSIVSDFLDRNPGGILTYSAILSNGDALPSWLKFSNGVFSGTPTVADSSKTLDVVVTATDQGSISTNFALNVGGAPPPDVQVADLKPVAASTLAASQLFSTTVASGSVQAYQFIDWWNTPTSGHFVLSGNTEAEATTFQVTPSELANLRFYVGSTHDVVAVRVFDGVNWSAWGTFNVDPQAGNLAPTVSSHIANQQDAIGATFNLNVTGNFSDPNGDALSYAATLANGAALPSWLHFSNGTFSGAPGAGDIGSLQIKVTASDPSQLSVSDTFSLTVPAAAQPSSPVVQVSDLKPTSGSTLLASQLFSASAGGAIQAYQFVDWWNTPTSGHFVLAGASKPEATTFQIAASDLPNLNYFAGSSHDLVAVRAFDGTTWSAWGTFNVDPQAGNLAPTVFSHITNQQDPIGAAFSLNVTANFSDPNGDALTYVATLANGTALPSWLHFSNGFFSGAPGAGDIGSLQIKVTASDPSLLSVSDTFSLTVPAAAQSSGPVLQVADLKPTSASTILASQLFSVTATGTIQAYQFVDWWNTPTSGHFVLSGVIEPEGSTFQIAASDLKSLNFFAGSTHDLVAVRAFDGTTWSAWGTFNVDPQAGNLAPTVSSQISNQFDTVGTAFSLNVTGNFSDPNGDALTYVATLANGTALPSWLHFSNGSFFGAPGAGDVGSLQIKVTANDPSQLSASNSFGLTVTAQPTLPGPVIQVSDLKPTSGSTVLASQLFSASDATGTIQAYQFVDWWNTPTSGHFVLTGASKPEATTFQIDASDLANLTFSAGSTHDLVAVRAFDGTTWSAWGTFNIDPQAGNLAPALTSQIASQQDTVGTTFNLNVTGNFSDPNGDALTYAATLANGTTLPTWLHFSKGIFSGTPGAGDVGSLQIRVTATDPLQLSVSGTFSLTVPAVAQTVGPVVQVADLRPASGSTVLASQLFSANDATGTIQAYQFVDWWNTPTSGHFILAGADKPEATTFQITASDLANLSFYAGSSHDLLAVRAFDGNTWSAWGTFNFDPI